MKDCIEFVFAVALFVIFFVSSLFAVKASAEEVCLELQEASITDASGSVLTCYYSSFELRPTPNGVGGRLVCATPWVIINSETITPARMGASDERRGQ